MRAPPQVLEVVSSHLTLLVEPTIELSSVMRLLVDVTQRCRPGLVLVRMPRNLLPRAALDEVAVVSRPCIIQICLEGRGCGRTTKSWVVGVDDLATWPASEGSGGIIGLGGCFASLGRAGSFLASQVGFCEPLLPGFLFPVVVAHTTPVDDDPASELSEHGPSGDDGNLP